MDVSGQLEAPAALLLVKNSGVHLIGGSVGLVLKKKTLFPCRDSNPGHRSEVLTKAFRRRLFEGDETKHR